MKYRYCINCGRKISPNIKFCPYCGAKQKYQSSQYNQHHVNRAISTKRIHSKATKLLATIFAVAILGGGAYYGYMNSPATVNLQHSMPGNTYMSSINHTKPSDETFERNGILKGHNKGDRKYHYTLTKHSITATTKSNVMIQRDYFTLKHVKQHDKKLYFKLNYIRLYPTSSASRRDRQYIESTNRHLQQKYDNGEVYLNKQSY